MGEGEMAKYPANPNEKALSVFLLGLGIAVVAGVLAVAGVIVGISWAVLQLMK